LIEKHELIYSLVFSGFLVMKTASPLITMKITSLLIIAYKSVFGSVVAGTFQIAFRAEIHANDVFSFFKNNF
jgi:hypothetical protein